MSEELKQFEVFTSATSSGSAKVMSTHWGGGVSSCFDFGGGDGVEKGEG